MRQSKDKTLKPDLLMLLPLAKLDVLADEICKKSGYVLKKYEGCMMTDTHKTFKTNELIKEDFEMQAMFLSMLADMRIPELLPETLIMCLSNYCVIQKYAMSIIKRLGKMMFWNAPLNTQKSSLNIIKTMLDYPESKVNYIGITIAKNLELIDYMTFPLILLTESIDESVKEAARKVSRIKTPKQLRKRWYSFDECEKKAFVHFLKKRLTEGHIWQKYSVAKLAGKLKLRGLLPILIKATNHWHPQVSKAALSSVYLISTKP